MQKKLIRTVLIVFVMVAAPGALFSQNPAPELRLDTGKQIYEAACIGCHGPNGKGQPQSTLGFEPPSTFPDFTDCNGSAREKNFDWRATIHEGGRARGFVEIMPAFGDALNADQIEKVMQYLREQCTEPSWPRGELNLPRALITEKAFPEDEVVLQAAVTTRSPRDVAMEFVFEKRFGSRNQLEVAVPFSFRDRENASWVGGIGDLVLGYKRTLFTSLK